MLILAVDQGTSATKAVVFGDDGGTLGVHHHQRVLMSAADLGLWVQTSQKLCDITVVGEGGLEPPHPFGHRNLNPARLPIPPLARVTGQE